MEAMTNDYRKHVLDSVSKFLNDELKRRDITAYKAVREMKAKGYKMSDTTFKSYIDKTAMISGNNILAIADYFEVSTDLILGAYDL